MKKKLFVSVISVVLCISLIAALPSVAFAASGNATADILGALTGQSGGNVNVSQLFSEWLKGQIDSNDKSVIDKFVEHIKNEWNGTETPDDDSTDADSSVTLREGEAANIADLFNITVNELKKSNPAFTKTQTASMNAKTAASLQGGLGPVTGIVESLIGTKDIFAGVIDGTQKSDNQIVTKYPYGNDTKNNIPVSGKNYVACLVAEDIKDYSITIYRSGAYSMHIDLIDVEGASAQSGLAHVFDTTDKAMATIELGTFSLNINVKLRYVNNYVECEVNRNGEITSYTMGMGITFLFEQEDGSYTSEMPYLGVDFAKEGIIYEIVTEFSGIKFGTRLMGDADNDGKVNSSDARLVLRMSAQLESCSEEDKPYCDVTIDGDVTAADAREILRASASLTILPTTEEALGIKPYQKDEKTKKQVSDILILMMAYQSAKDADEQKKLQDSYNDKYNVENTTAAPSEETTKTIHSTGDTVNEIISGIGGFVGGLISKN